MTHVELTGLNGFNPLGFLAALGTLRIVAEAFPDAKLGWRVEAGRHAYLEFPGSELVDVLVADLEAWRVDAPELDLHYPKNGTGPVVYDLKPRPAAFRAFCLSAQDRAIAGSRRHADYAASYSAAHPLADGSGVGVDGKGNAKPTALHFTAGQQDWLAMVRKLRTKVTREQLAEALVGPWSYSSQLPSLRWDTTGERSYALLAGDPSADKVKGNPGADWLAFRGLCFYPTFLHKGSTTTRAVPGRGKRYAFWWPLWKAALGVNTVGSLVGSDLPRLASRTNDRALRGVSHVLRSTIRRTDQGGYGSFSPPDVV